MSDKGRPFIPPTVVLPNPGGAAPRRGSEPASPGPGLAAGRAPDGFAAAPRPAPGDARGLAAARPGVNPLVDKASELFDLIVYLQGQASAPELGLLRDKTLALLRRFESESVAAGVDPEIADGAKYAAAATIDDLVMAKPWGLAGGWERQKLVAALYREVIGGERFFELLKVVEAQPQRYGDLLEFMYICLSLGFEGAYRMPGRTARTELESHRAGAFESIRARRDGFAGALSPRWQGTEAARKPLREIVPLWLAGAVSLAVTAGVYVLAVLLIGGQTARAVEGVSAMTPAAEVEIVALEAPSEPAPPQPSEQTERVGAFLADEIAAGRVEVFTEGGQTRIRLVGSGMFRSGRAVLQDSFLPVLQRVSTALNDEPGRVLVEGHSDAEPISTARFPSNFHLSEARAAAVAAFMRDRLETPTRLDVIGLGDTALLDREHPRSGVNRRVELVLNRPEG